MLYEEAEKLFLKSCEGKRLKEYSLRSYRSTLKQFRELFGFSGVELSEMSPMVLSQMDIQHVKQSSAWAYFRVFRQFLRWTYEIGIIREPLHNFVQQPRRPMASPKAVSEETIEKFIGSFCGNRPLDVRNRTMFRFMFATGVRVSELVNLKIIDVDLHARQAIIRHSKRDRTRAVLFGDVTAEALRQWLQKRSHFSSDPAGYLFCGVRGGKLTRWAITDLCKKGSETAGKTITPHVFRHSFATAMMENGADLRTIQHLLGHSSISTTERYLTVTAKFARKTYEKCHPLG